ncbi:MAG TPA: hypothetical protein VM574_10620, partial [Terrimicrobiaceae bacterium]|nr:hypothetical protein [Terrimicrobiaceae bacterium]
LNDTGASKRRIGAHANLGTRAKGQFVAAVSPWPTAQLPDRRGGAQVIQHERSPFSVLVRP